MSTCPHLKGELRPELPEVPERMKHLPIDRGYPVPWFVHWSEGKPEFRIMDAPKMIQAIRESLCWVCGQAFTNRRKFFVLGPMCSINRISAEPPCHEECALFSVTGCPFLTKPHMVRRENDLPEEVVVQEGHNPSNPEAMAIWHTRSFQIYQSDSTRVPLFIVGDPIDTAWFVEGRPATRAQVTEALIAGALLLMEEAKAKGPEEVREMKLKIAYVIDNPLPREVAA